MHYIGKLLFLFTILTDLINIKFDDQSYIDDENFKSGLMPQHLVEEDIFENQNTQNNENNYIKEEILENKEAKVEKVVEVKKEEKKEEEEVEEKLVYQPYNRDFKYAFNCTFGEATLCDKVDSLIQKAMDTLSNTFEIYQPVVFDAYVDNLSKYNNTNLSCGCIDTNYVVLRRFNDETTPPYAYPQALAKQLNLNKKVDYQEKDFTLVIDSSAYYTNFKTNDYQNNLELSILHDMLHGFGFGSETGQIMEVLKENSVENDTKYDLYDFYFVPREIKEINRKRLAKIKSREDYTVFWPTIKYKGLFPLSIYEKHFVDLYTKTSLFENIEFLYQKLNCFRSEYLVGFNDRFPRCVKALSARTRHLISLIPMSYYFKQHSMGFLTKEGKVIPLQTFDYKYRWGKSINHIEFTKEEAFNALMNATRSDTDGTDGTGRNWNDKRVTEANVHEYLDDNVLMYYREVGLSESFLRATVAKENAYGLISPDILSVLTTLGWTEKGMPKDPKVYYVADELTIPEQLSFPLMQKVHAYASSYKPKKY